MGRGVAAADSLEHISVVRYRFTADIRDPSLPFRQRECIADDPFRVSGFDSGRETVQRDPVCGPSARRSHDPRSGCAVLRPVASSLSTSTGMLRPTHHIRFHDVDHFKDIDGPNRNPSDIAEFIVGSVRPSALQIEINRGKVRRNCISTTHSVGTFGRVGPRITGKSTVASCRAGNGYDDRSWTPKPL